MFLDTIWLYGFYRFWVKKRICQERLALKWVAIGGRVVTVLGDIHSMRKKQRARLKALRSVNDKFEYIHEHHMNIKVYIVTIPIGPRGSPQEFSGLQSAGNVMRCHVMSYHFKTSQSSRHLGSVPGSLHPSQRCPKWESLFTSIYIVFSYFTDPKGILERRIIPRVFLFFGQPGRRKRN